MSHTFGLFMFWSGVACWCALILRSGFICSRELARRNRSPRQDEHECDAHVLAQALSKRRLIMSASVLTLHGYFGFNATAAPHGQSGVETRNQGGQAASNSGFYFVRQHLQPSLGGGVGGGNPCRFLDPVSNLHRCPPMRGNVRGWFNQPSRSLAMSSATTQAVFNFNNSEVRTIVKDGQPWFIAADVCAALGYSNSRKAIADHLDDDERCNQSLQRGGELTIINESGLYALVLRSRKPEARKFAKWVTSEVLPAIRKTGGYSTTPSMLNRRWLISYDRLGREQVQSIDWNDCLLKYEDLPKLLAAPDNMVESALLLDIIKACAERLATRNKNNLQRKAA